MIWHCNNCNGYFPGPPAKRQEALLPPSAMRYVCPFCNSGQIENIPEPGEKKYRK